jgi:hypothetical protein
MTPCEDLGIITKICLVIILTVIIFVNIMIEVLARPDMCPKWFLQLFYYENEVGQKNHKSEYMGDKKSEDKRADSITEDMPADHSRNNKSKISPKDLIMLYFTGSIVFREHINPNFEDKEEHPEK